MKSEWITKKVGELTSYISKGIPPKYVDEKTSSTVSVLNQKCNRDFRISYEQSRWHDTAIKYVPMDKMLRYGDVLINSTGAGTAGRIAQFFDNSIPTTVDGHMIIMRASKEIDYLYYGYALKLNQKKIELLAEGSTGQTEINKQRLQEEISISYPNNIDLQHSIALTFKRIDDKIELNNKINENLELQAQAIFKSWFVDFEPFGGVMPEDWKIGMVDDLSKEIVCGKTPSTKKEEYYGNDIPFITIPDMHNCTYVLSTERKLSKLGANTQIKKTLPKHSICVSCIGTAGLVVLVPTESQTNQQINSIIPKSNYSSYYIFLLMKTLSERINSLGQSGSTIVNLNKTQFGKIEVLVPSIDSMNKFDFVVNSIFEKILNNQKENIQLSNLRDTLLPKLMNGEIDVSEVKI